MFSYIFIRAHNYEIIPKGTGSFATTRKYQFQKAHSTQEK